MLRLLAGALLTAQLAAAQGSTGAGSPSPQESVIDLSNFKDCGLITRFAPNKISKECFQSINNAVLDNDFTIKRRNGYTAYNPSACTGGQPIRGIWPFFGTDGSQYLIVYSSGSMSSSKADGTCSLITGLTSLSLTAQMDCVQTLSYLWCTNGTDPVFRTNVISTQTVTQAPTGAVIGAFRNRVIISDVSGNLTNVYMSGELNGLDFTLPAITYSTSPVILNIAGTNDGQNVSCLMGEFQNQYLVGRNYDLYGMTGYDTRDFAVHQISNQVGCIDEKSIQEVNNVKYWLSRRGIESYTGTQIDRASFPIDPTLAVIIAAAGNSQGQAFNGTNFTQGNLCASGSGSCVSATVSPSNIVPSSWSVLDVSTVTVGSSYGSFSTITANGVGLFTLGLSHVGFEDADNFFTGWTQSAPPIFTINSNSACSTGVQCFGSKSAVTITGGGGWGGTSLVNFNVYDGNGNLRLSQQYNFASNGCSVPMTIDVSTLTDANIQIGISSPYNGKYFYSNAFPKPKGFVTANTEFSANCGGLLVFDTINPPYLASSGTYTSAVFDTKFSTPVLAFTPTEFQTPLGGSVYYQIETATSSSGVFSSPALISSITAPGTPNNEFLRYAATIWASPTNYNQSSSVALKSVALAAEATGYYISPCITATGNTAWGNFTVDAVNNGGSFTFWMSTSATSCAQVTDPVNANWTLQTANSIISVTVSSYTAVRALLNMTSASQVPTLNDFTVNWNVGTTRPPVASSRYNNEYWLFYTSNTAVGAHNDHALNYDENHHWTLFDDVNAYSAALYLNKLYIGDSNATGTIYQMDIGASDNGGNFAMSFQTPDLDDGDPLSLKKFRNLYVMLSAQGALNGGAVVSCSYNLDGSATTYSLGSYTLSESKETSGYAVAKFPFPLGQADTGHWISVGCSNIGAVGPLNVYGLKIVYKKTSWD